MYTQLFGRHMCWWGMHSVDGINKDSPISTIVGIHPGTNPPAFDGVLKRAACFVASTRLREQRFAIMPILGLIMRPGS